MRRFFACLLVLAAACGVTNPDREVVTLEVAPNRVPCVGEGVQECLLVREPSDREFRYFYETIEGFTHEPGYRYVLRVERREVRNPPVDASNVAYRLVRMLSRQIGPQG